MQLPFITPPAQTSKRRIGNDQCGIIEVEVRGGLTVGESAVIAELLAAEQSSFVRGAQIADAIAKAEDISISEAFTIIESAIAGRPLEDAAAEIRVRHATGIEEVARVYSQAGQRNMEACVTAVIRSRLQRPEWSIDDTRLMDRPLFSGLWQLVQDEQEAEQMATEAVTEEELGKPLAAAGKSRPRTGRP
jgi:hypothetical protein